jgi:N-acyl homoserine lactone hydrolase
MKKIIIFAGILIFSVSLVYAVTVCVLFSIMTAEPYPSIAKANPLALPPELKLTDQNKKTGSRIKVFMLQTGWSRAPFGQFFSGLKGWTGKQALWKMNTADDFLWAPVKVVVIIHPEKGPVLIDAGLSKEQTQEGYYSIFRGGRTGFVWKAEENRLPREQELVPQLKKMGYAPQDVRHVVLTHLHEDHVGDVRQFRDAVVHVSEIEWQDRERISYAAGFSMITKWDFITFNSGKFASFNASQDLFGDGTVILLPAFGQSLGHMGVFVNMGNYQMYIAGDSLYTLRHLATESIASFNYFGEEGLAVSADTIKRVAALQKDFPDLIIIPPHDLFDYNAKLLAPFLEDGVLTAQERKQLRSYQDSLFDHSGHLKKEALPRYVPGAEGAVAADIP